MPTTNLDLLTANGVTAPLTGAVTGNVSGNLTGNVTGAINSPAPTVLSADGALAIPTIGNASFSITKGSAAALTLVAPAAGTDDGKILTIVSETAYAHVVTCATDGFNNKGSSGTATWATAKGNYLVLMARNGHWWSVGLTGVTLA